MDATADYAPDSLPPALVEGHRLAQEAGDSDLVRWLKAYPELACDLGRFLASEAEVGRLIAHSHPADPAGTRIGQYQLLERIGEGGMGVVYRAWDTDLNKEVALKLLLTGHLHTPEERARFRFEAKAAASLEHENIVQVFVLGDAGGDPYLVMPLMEGGSLADWLKSLGPDRRRPPEESAQLVRDIALGVHHAHQRGLLHRDLKPGNILLDRAGKFDGPGKPHVADFGLAHRLDVSVSAGVAGTAAYMAPEQARGERGRLTTAVDVHALGAILFELLTGAPPFGTGDLAAVLRRVTEEAAPSVRQQRPDVPADLEFICRKCLQKNPEDRYPSAAALADDLTRFLNGEPLPGQPTPGVREWLRRALRQRREARTIPSWRAAFWGAASTFAALAVIQAAVLLDAPAWVAQAGFGYYLIGWTLILWGFLVARRDTLDPIERASTALQYGMALAVAAAAAGQLWLHGGQVTVVFQPLLAVVGLGIFAHGFTYWGRLYLAGGLLMLISAAMPLIPITYWPGVYGLTLTLFQLWVGYHLYRADRAGRVAADGRLLNAADPPP